MYLYFETTIYRKISQGKLIRGVSSSKVKREDDRRSRNLSESSVSFSRRYFTYLYRIYISSIDFEDTYSLQENLLGKIFREASSSGVRESFGEYKTSKDARVNMQF